MSDLYTLSQQFRDQLLRRERRAASSLVRAYGAAWRRIRTEARAIAAQIEEARRAGVDVNQAWLLRQGRLESLQRQVEIEVAKIAQFADERIQQEQQAVIEAARAHSTRLTEAALGRMPEGISIRVNRLPVEAFKDLVGNLSDGTPLRALLDSLGPAASAAIRNALIESVALGHGPAQSAREMRAALGGNLTQALRISRTEIVRVYRTSSHRTYRANAHVIKGWIWHSSLSKNTCAACWAMHGTIHTLDEELNDHVQGRCTPIPKTKTWAELGFDDMPDNSIQVETGESAFARLPEADQRAVLGDAGFRAFRDGKVSLTDFVGTRTSQRWGTSRYRRSLTEILGEEQAQAYRRSA